MSQQLDIEAIKRRDAWCFGDGDKYPEFRDDIKPPGLRVNLGGATDAMLDRRDLIAEVERLTTWRPIVEAPKDGTEIRCWCPDIGERVLYLRRGKWTLAGGGLDRNDYEPTHWQPLPDEGPTS